MVRLASLPLAVLWGASWEARGKREVGAGGMAHPDAPVVVPTGRHCVPEVASMEISDRLKDDPEAWGLVFSPGTRFTVSGRGTDEAAGAQERRPPPLFAQVLL